MRRQLKDITNELCYLIRGIPIKTFVQPHPFIVMLAPDFYWGNRTPDQDQIQLQLKRKYDIFSEILFLMLRNAPTNLSERLESADEAFRIWLELERNYSLSPNADENEKRLLEDSQNLEQLIDILEAKSEEEIILIPDTNSLLISSDPVVYSSIAQTDSFIFLLLPTVLAELDNLKILHRNPDVREKAEKTIKRIKGWRNQGTLYEGVKVSGNIKVAAEYREPDMNNTLSWLDTDNSDDRIIASILSVIVHNPTAKVVLVTGDINLQNKADSAMIEVKELEVE